MLGQIKDCTHRLFCMLFRQWGFNFFTPFIIFPSRRAVNTLEPHFISKDRLFSSAILLPGIIYCLDFVKMNSRFGRFGAGWITPQANQLLQLLYAAESRKKNRKREEGKQRKHLQHCLSFHFCPTQFVTKPALQFSSTTVSNHFMFLHCQKKYLKAFLCFISISLQFILGTQFCIRGLSFYIFRCRYFFMDLFCTNLHFVTQSLKPK